MSVETETQSSEPDNSPQAWADAGEPDDTAAPASEAASDEQPEEAPQADGEQATEQPAEEADPYAEAPEFWSAERKAAYARITDPEARKAIHEQERERNAAVSRKIEEAALERKKYETDAQAAIRDRDELAAWWRDQGPKIANAFQNKWAAYTPDVMNRLAAENPGQWAQIKQAMEHDAQLLHQASVKHQAELQAANQRAERALQENKRAEHAKLEQRLPEYFKGEKAQATYDALGKYLAEKGFPADRITAIYEADVIEIAHKAMLYDQAKANAAKVSTQQQTPATATQTPRRVAPGPSTRTGNPQQSDAYRQASERLKNGDRLTEQDARLLFA